ncbi:MAG: glycosyltransferase, partial [Candidatus Omnitrophica bacterium]|nr:glycosyltransferase [Candidatus Omnitrophota bacterium]
MRDDPIIMIIILNWNGFSDTVECLDSLRDSGADESCVVLVDNGSDNDEGARIKELFPGIQLIQNDHNRGFAGGNNDGIDFAINNGAELIALLNNDCVVEKEWLPRLVRAVRGSGADFAASMILFHPERDTICTDEDALYPDGSGIAVNRYQHPRSSADPRKIASACAAAALYSAPALDDVKVGEGQYFDELYFAYNEDIDLAMRLGAKGYTGITVPDACVYHKHSRTSGRFSFFKMFHSEKNRILNEIFHLPLYFIVVG